MFEELKRKARWAEQHGYTWFSVMDHLIQIPGVGQPEEPFMEGWTVLSALAAVTEKIRLATLVTSVAYRNPALLAKMAAGVDIISGGRLTFGFGAGWYYQEYGQYGYQFPERPAVRIRQMEEALKLIKLMWTEPRATFYGKYFHVEEAILEPKPLQKPYPPIMIGGGGEQLTLRVLARHGNACNLFGDPATVRHKLDVLRQHCEAEQRDYNTIERTNLTSLLLARTETELQGRDWAYRVSRLCVSVRVSISLAHRRPARSCSLPVSCATIGRNCWRARSCRTLRLSLCETVQCRQSGQIQPINSAAGNPEINPGQPNSSFGKSIPCQTCFSLRMSML
jgi:F420-dependent oxidoreductase-like protein